MRFLSTRCVRLSVVVYCQSLYKPKCNTLYQTDNRLNIYPKFITGPTNSVISEIQNFSPHHFHTWFKNIIHAAAYLSVFRSNRRLAMCPVAVSFQIFLLPSFPVTSHKTNTRLARNAVPHAFSFPFAPINTADSVRRISHVCC